MKSLKTKVTTLYLPASCGLLIEHSDDARSLDYANEPQNVGSAIKPKPLPRNHHFGFTFIEMLVALFIMSILTLIAYPAYIAWVLKANRADAMATLARDQAILEQCYAQNFSYNGTCSALPTFPQASAQSFYSINLTNLTATTYTLTATPTDSQAKDTTCATMSINQASQKTASDSAGNAQSVCWNP